ncbi:MAG: hypothetical protein JRN52_14540 [Nitrososphaerota archaeon]|nr:hypothetical protein [Nitrososphaerota archaeon]
MWLREIGNSRCRIGINSVLLFLAGRLNKIGLKTELRKVASMQMIGTIESNRYFGAVRCPVEGEISAFNLDLLSDPRPVNDSPYENGWFAEITGYDPSALSKLDFGESARTKLESRIRELKVKCMKVLPDEQMFSIGIECSTTFSNLGEILANKPAGHIVHLVTDEPTAGIEMIRWSIQTKNEIVEERKEEKLFHFLVRKA